MVPTVGPPSCVCSGLCFHSLLSSSLLSLSGQGARGVPAASYTKADPPPPPLCFGSQIAAGALLPTPPGGLRSSLITAFVDFPQRSWSGGTEGRNPLDALWGSGLEAFPSSLYGLALPNWWQTSVGKGPWEFPDILRMEPSLPNLALLAPRTPLPRAP